MIRVPRHHSHFLFGIIQSGLTCGIAAAVAELRNVNATPLFRHWLESWLFSWTLMLPVVLFAAPYIRRLVQAMTDDPTS